METSYSQKSRNDRHFFLLIPLLVRLGKYNVQVILNHVKWVGAPQHAFFSAKYAATQNMPPISTVSLINTALCQLSGL